MLSFAPGPGKVLISHVSGLATLTIPALNGPDGTPSATDIPSINGISGIKANVHGFLVGVFLGTSEPANPSPAVLNFGGGGLDTGFSTLSPTIGQTFFIGDGETGTGADPHQQINIPDGATRLYLGFADANGYVGQTGQYQDNSGSFTADVCIAELLSIPATANIFGAGHATPPNPGGGSAGTLPPLLSFAPGPGKVLISYVRGLATLTIPVPTGPDGTPSGTDIPSINGISGIKSDVHGFLVGVFLGTSEPANPSPAVLNFGGGGLGTGFATLSPAVGQTFFIGDGETGIRAGPDQQINIPDGATRLYLGFADAYGYVGQAGQYQDNSGSLDGRFWICSGSHPVTAITNMVDRHDLYLAPISPNPSRHGFQARFSLPRASRASLEVVDIGGRMVRHLQVGDMGPGMHLIELGRDRLLRAGVYLVRLSEDGQSVTQRVSILN
ncbi:MAG: T9SS type A sorting domain-containing protein [Candidatus Eisenbacteria bacterium]